MKQKEVALRLGVDEQSICGWELNWNDPRPHYLPQIIGFLGYALYRPVQGLPAKLKLWREALGLSQEDLAKEMEVNEATLSSWERGEHKPIRGSLRSINECFTRLFGTAAKIQ